MTSHIYKRGDVFYYRRRVPEYVLPYETRNFVKISLSTRDEKEATRKAVIYNDYIEDYWRSLIKAGGSDDTLKSFRATVALAKAHGFAYKNAAEIAKEPLEQMIRRINAAEKAIESPQIVSAILGGAEQPHILLSECIDKYWPLCADRLTNKSEDQIRKWKNPRICALKAFIEAIGDKCISQITRKDVLTCREWWMVRVESGDVVAATVNKNLIQVRDILQVVGMHYEIATDFEVLFVKTKLKDIERSRPPFERDFVQNALLFPKNLAGMNFEAQMLIYAMADTGARESELIGLEESDIFLDEDIPYIWIRPADNRALKTITSERKIPLVGASLYAFQKIPKGFQHYKNADTASTAINKFLRENDLKPTPKHTLYSLRHTFKDRLRDADAPEEIIDELMGHKKSGPKYGRGHMMEKKYEWMQRIAFCIPI